MIDKYFQDCEGKNDTQMKCITPKLDVNTTDTEGWSMVSRRKRDLHSIGLEHTIPPLKSRKKRELVDELLEPGQYDLVVGFVFDGFDEFKDISKANSTQHLAEEFDIIPAPTLEGWKDPVRVYDPKHPNNTIEILVGLRIQDLILFLAMKYYILY